MSAIRLVPSASESMTLPVTRAMSQSSVTTPASRTVLTPCQVIAISVKTNAQRVGGYDTSGFALNVAVQDYYAYVADQYSGVQVIDLSDPTDPRPIGSFQTSGTSRGVAVQGHFAYLAD